MSALAAELKRLVALEGPITVARYMALCLGHPLHGYYMRRDPFGVHGDFTTAPEISQMFGELIGLWAAEVWTLIGRPDPIRLVELGPGRGTLMADALRAAGIVPPFRQALSVHLVETSPVLRERQRATLWEVDAAVSWHDRVEDVPTGPAIVIANEFFDALPVRQFVGTERGWCERLVGLSGDDLAFGLAAEPDPGIAVPVRPGAVLERPEAAVAVAGTIAARLAAEGGAALVIDYGHVRSGFGDTLQAVRDHAYADPLATPGEADLTVHVDFAALARAAESSGAGVFGPETQGDFLRALGIAARAQALKARATAAQAEAIDAALARLTGPGPDGMGDLFKVIAFAGTATAPLPGLARRTPSSPPPEGSP